MPPTDKPNPKLDQFKVELKLLSEKYQYALIPELEYLDSGIKAFIGIRDVIPPQEPIPEEPVKEVEPEVPTNSETVIVPPLEPDSIAPSQNG